MKGTPRWAGTAVMAIAIPLLAIAIWNAVDRQWVKAVLSACCALVLVVRGRSIRRLAGLGAQRSPGRG